MPPVLITCIEKSRLLAAYAEAASEYNLMQRVQAAAVQNGEEPGFQEEIARASGRKNEAKHAVTAHQEEHGC